MPLSVGSDVIDIALNQLFFSVYYLIFVHLYANLCICLEMNAHARAPPGTVLNISRLLLALYGIDLV